MIEGKAYLRKEKLSDRDQVSIVEIINFIIQEVGIPKDKFFLNARNGDVTSRQSREAMLRKLYVYLTVKYTNIKITHIGPKIKAGTHFARNTINNFDRKDEAVLNEMEKLFLRKFRNPKPVENYEDRFLGRI